MESLNEKTSPFRETHTRKVFKNTANLSLRGTTYDATHMDKFLGSQYCNLNVNATATNKDYNANKSLTAHSASNVNHRSSSINNKLANDNSNNAKSLLKSYMTTSNTIRPSVAFTSSSRDQVPRVLTYVDLYDGPSSLQQRDGEVTLNDKLKESGQGSIYE